MLSFFRQFPQPLKVGCGEDHYASAKLAVQNFSFTFVREDAHHFRLFHGLVVVRALADRLELVFRVDRASAERFAITDELHGTQRR